MYVSNAIALISILYTMLHFGCPPAPLAGGLDSTDLLVSMFYTDKVKERVKFSMFKTGEDL